jgi:PTH1 family peptidyl-tRNA hydrolase
MKLIVGLGNPGEKYTGTRHNLGFEVLDTLLKKYKPVNDSQWETDKKSKSLVKKIKIKTHEVILSKPQTYMNNSGLTVGSLTTYYKIKPQDVVVIHDELDLPLGKIQIKFGGGTAGHNGLESIIKSIGTDKFLRIRMGIGKPVKVDGSKFESRLHNSGAEHVLEKFSQSEEHEAKNMVKHVQKNLELLLSHGFDTFMSKFSSKS